MPAYANFTTVWTITWPDFEDIQRNKISKIILPSYKNVVFGFRMEFSSAVEGNDAHKFGMSIFYEDGPLCSLDDCRISYRLRKGTKILATFGERYQAKRGEGSHWPNVEEKDINRFKNKYSLDTSDDLHYFITISIPLASFDCEVYKRRATIKERPSWVLEIFERLEDVEKAKLSDVRFVAGDGGTFYCHRIVVETQSKELETMLDNPISENEKSGTFCFPTLDTGSLNAILKYLYTGEYDLLIELPAPLIIQVGDFSEQYGLKVLKEASISQLWEIIGENPKHAVEILRFADLHHEAKYLKDRAMNVITENFEKLSLKLCDFSGGNGNDIQGNRLKEEFILYSLRRLGITELEEEKFTQRRFGGDEWVPVLGKCRGRGIPL